jgi:hypothetical protein
MKSTGRSAFTPSAHKKDSALETRVEQIRPLRIVFRGRTDSPSRRRRALQIQPSMRTFLLQHLSDAESGSQAPTIQGLDREISIPKEYPHLAQQLPPEEFAVVLFPWSSLSSILGFA